MNDAKEITNVSSAAKVFRKILWIVVVGVGGYVLAHGMMRIRESSSVTIQNLMQYLYENIEEAAAKYYMATGFHDTEQSDVWDRQIWEKIWDSVPLITYAEQEYFPETIIEDEETYDLIIEESKNMIRKQMISENMEKKQQEDISQNKEQNITEESLHGDKQEVNVTQTELEEDEALPSWAAVSESVDGVLFSEEKLQDFEFIKNQFFVVDPNTTTNAQQLQGKVFMEKDFKINQSQTPQILIYHTHSQEMYADSIEGDENTSVIGVGNYLHQILEDVFGYKVIHLKNTFDIVDGSIDRSNAYTYALPVIEQTLQEYPSIEVVIDLHRDGVAEDKHLVTEINGKQTAQIMLFNGLSKTVNNGELQSLPNPYIQDNLAFSFQLAYHAKAFYPDLMRCIYLKGYRYNLHVRPRSILLEVGAQTNTVQEAMNAMEPFSVLLNKVLKEE